MLTYLIWQCTPLACPGAAPRRPPPQQDQFLSFSHTFSLKSVRIGGWRPPQREILDPPLHSVKPTLGPA